MSLKNLYNFNNSSNIESGFTHNLKEVQINGEVSHKMEDGRYKIIHINSGNEILNTDGESLNSGLIKTHITSQVNNLNTVLTNHETRLTSIEGNTNDLTQNEEIQNMKTLLNNIVDFINYFKQCVYVGDETNEYDYTGITNLE